MYPGVCRLTLRIFLKSYIKGIFVVTTFFTNIKILLLEIGTELD